MGRCRVPSRSTVALSQDVLGEHQRHGASPRVVRGLSLRGEKPIRGYPLGGRGLGVTPDPVSCCRALQAQIDHGEPGVGTEAPGGRRAGAGQGIAVPKGSPMSPSESPAATSQAWGSGRESCAPGGLSGSGASPTRVGCRPAPVLMLCLVAGGRAAAVPQLHEQQEPRGLERIRLPDPGTARCRVGARPHPPAPSPSPLSPKLLQGSC